MLNKNSQISLKRDDFLLRRKEAFGTLCQAPYTTLNFSQQGVINVCCANRDYHIGSFPENKLDEIWNGEKITKLRKEMDLFSFNSGCAQCELLLNSGNFKSLKINHYDTFESNQKGSEQSFRNLKYPYRLDFELDNNCNLECIMCNGIYSSSIRKNREKGELYKSPYDSDDFFEQLKPYLYNARKIGFFGGEPFLINVYYKIFDYLIEHNLNPICYVQTNGTIYTERIKNYLEKLDIHLSVSLDAATKSIYEKIRKNANFEKTISNIEKYKEILDRKKNVFYMSPVIFTENLFDIKNILDIANKFNAKLYFHHLEFPHILNLKYESKEILKKAINFYRNPEMFSSQYNQPEFKGSAHIKSHNTNAFFDVLRYIKYCYINHEKNNPLSVDNFIKIYSCSHKEKYELILDRIIKNSLNKDKMLKYLSVLSKNDLEEFLNKDYESFIYSLDKFIIERGILLKNDLA